MACSCYNANYYFISSMLRDRERLDGILYTCTQHGFWIVSVKHVVLFCYGYRYIYVGMCICIRHYISNGIIQPNNDAYPQNHVDLKMGSLDRRCFPEIRTTREEIVLKNTTACRCRENVVRAWPLTRNRCPDEVLRKFK